MPPLFSLGQHRALNAVQARLMLGEQLFAFLDDIRVVCQPDRVCAVHAILGEELWNHANISINDGKTQVWNKSGTEPHECEGLTAAARLVNPEAVVWRGDPELAPC